MEALLNTKSLVLFFAVVVYFFGGYLLIVKQELKKNKKFKFLPRATFGFISGSAYSQNPIRLAQFSGTGGPQGLEVPLNFATLTW